MSFTKQPVNSTYSTKKVGLLKELASRGTSTAKDAYLLNAYAEIQEQKDIGDKDAIITSRAGVAEGIASVGTGGVRGAYLWKDQNKLFICVGADIYVYTASTGALVTTLSTVFGTTSGHVGMEEFLYADTTTKLVVTDGTTLKTIDTSNTVSAASATVPVHQPYPLFLDGYLFVVKTNSSSIYNSKQDDPTDYTALEWIDAEMRPDQVVLITLLNNYLVAFGTKTLEYFFDAANASGSPLSRNDSPIKAVGYIGGLAKHGNKAIFVGETNDTIPDVYIIEDFKITNVGTDAIRRHLESHNTGITGAVVSFNGHDFYVMTTDSATYAMDLDKKLWQPWSYAATSTFPITFSFPQSDSTHSYRNWFVTSIDQSVNYFNTALGTDKGTNFPVTVVTDNEFFDSYNQKYGNRLTVVADKPSASQVVTVSVSDDDYQTWSYSQTIDLYQELPCAYRWGRFRRRAHKVHYAGGLPLRLYGLELDINLGNT